MVIPILSIVGVLILVAALWWAIIYLKLPEMITRVAVVVLVILAVVWLVGILTGSGPSVSFR